MMSRNGTKWMLVAGAGLLLGGVARAQAAPPWSQEGNPAAQKGYVFRVPDVDNVPDLHGNPATARLVLFIGGNQFFVLPKLVQAFETLHPELRGAIYYETLPPGILRRQMAHGGTLTLGNLTLTVKPDVYEAGLRVVRMMVARKAVEAAVPYATNNLAIMVRKGNPKGIRSLRDLGRADVRLSMPNPEWEGVSRQIEASLRKAGGEALVKQVMVSKRQAGTTLLTEIHHRQTPMRLMRGEVDAGVTWSSEAKFQERIGNPIGMVAIPPSENVTAIYAAGVVKGARHAKAAHAWVAFLRTAEAQLIYREYGFQPVPGRVQEEH